MVVFADSGIGAESHPQGECPLCRSQGHGGCRLLSVRHRAQSTKDAMVSGASGSAVG